MNTITTNLQETVNNFTCFDYAAQKWIYGEPALRLIIKQLGEEISLLCSPRGAEYLQSVQKRTTPTRKTLIEAIKAAYSKRDKFKAMLESYISSKN